MASGAESTNDLPFVYDESYETLFPRAARIDGMLTSMLERPDWDITTLHFQAPFGPDYQFELETLTSRPRLSTPNYRRIGLFINPDSGHVGYAAYARFDDHVNTRDVSVMTHQASLASLLGSSHEIPNDFIELVADMVKLKTDTANKQLMSNISSQCAFLLMQGCVDYRQRIWHTLYDGTKVYLIKSKKEGEQPWPQIDSEADAKIRVQSRERVIDFRRTRDGIYQTFETIPDRRSELSSVVGSTMVLGSGDNAADIDYGDNYLKHAAIDQAEAAMGLRDLDAERLDRIEEALTKVAAERKEA